MFYFIDYVSSDGNTQRHILQPLHDGGMQSFPMIDDNPNMVAYLAWVAKGNTAEEWTGE